MTMIFECESCGEIRQSTRKRADGYQRCEPCARRRPSAGAVVEVPADVAIAIADHLAQYRRYSEEMRAIGRGLYLSTPIGAELVARVLDSAIGAAKL